MNYYNVHTHNPPLFSDEKTIISLDIRKEDQLNPLHFYSAGIHPWYASENYLDKLYDIAKNPNVVAIGETGLDKLSQIPWDKQNKLFLIQIEIAENLGKPLIIHCVKAWQELYTIYKKKRHNIPWIIHGFRGKEELACQLINAGFQLSFGQYYQSKAVWKAWNAKCLFLETDESSMNIKYIYESISTLLAVSKEQISLQILRNLQGWPQSQFL